MSLTKKIVENWTAIEEVEQTIREQTGDPEAGFNVGGHGVEGNGLALRAMYRGTGEGEGFINGYRDLLIYAKFCPFTGKPLYEED
jgi:hypothetical protein